MTRFVCFDQTATDTVRATGADATQRRGNPLLAALREPGNSVVIMPVGSGEELAVVSMVKRGTPKKAAAPAVEFVNPISRTGTGFLGLSDEPEFADEPEKKPWWKRR